MPAARKEHGAGVGVGISSGKVLPFPLLNLTSSFLIINSFLHSLFIGLDANFRLKRKDISNDEKDPGLGHGIAYIVEERAFKSHITAHAGEKEPVSFFYEYEHLSVC